MIALIVVLLIFVLLIGICIFVAFEALVYKMLVIGAEVLCSILLVASVWMLFNGIVRGVHPESGMTVKEFITDTLSSPIDDSTTVSDMLDNSSMPDGTIIVFYRADCEDCHNTLSSYIKTLDDSDKVYFVCTRSDVGSKLKVSADVQYVPEFFEVENNTLVKIDDGVGIDRLDALL